MRTSFAECRNASKRLNVGPSDRNQGRFAVAARPGGERPIPVRMGRHLVAKIQEQSSEVSHGGPTSGHQNSHGSVVSRRFLKKSRDAAFAAYCSKAAIRCIAGLDRSPGA